MSMLLSRLRPPWWVRGGDTDARHLPIAAGSINRKQSKTYFASSWRTWLVDTVVLWPVRKATCDFAPSNGRKKAARARQSRRACAIASRRYVHGSNSGRRPTSRSRDPECEHVPEHEVFLTVMYRCSVEPSVPVYLSCSGHSPEHASAIFGVQAFI